MRIFLCISRSFSFHDLLVISLVLGQERRTWTRWNHRSTGTKGRLSFKVVMRLLRGFLVCIVFSSALIFSRQSTIKSICGAHRKSRRWTPIEASFFKFYHSFLLTQGVEGPQGPPGSQGFSGPEVCILTLIYLSFEGRFYV